MKWPWRKPRPPSPEPDRLQVAILEYELFGIKPDPAAAVEFMAKYRYPLGSSNSNAPGYRRDLDPAEAQAAYEARR
ncbi:hypothetical protein [Streptomyces sp. NPDC051994]|uniref:hypothetical protein n=1 Tax=unclassified Streptomyces TaxID=2593676 RepID=UPI00343B1422